MILRLATNAAVHTAGGVVFGLTAALAACTVAQVGVVALRRADRMRRETSTVPRPSYAPPPSMTPGGPPGI